MGHSEETKKKMSKAAKGRVFSKETRKKLSEAKKGKKLSETTKNKIRESLKGRKRSKETINKMKKSMKGKFDGKNHPQWKGGVTEKNLPLYNTYASQIEYAEEVRRSPNNENMLEVKCTYCGKWYIPKTTDIWHRRNSLNSNITGEYRLYCSSSCKQECSIYNQKKYPKGYKKASSREVQPELRQMVFKRDDWTCQKCKSKKNLHCHHIEGIRWEPIESADIDQCITYCKTCHKEAHDKEGCGYQDMRCG
jgi:hypothetical protein